MRWKWVPALCSARPRGGSLHYDFGADSGSGKSFTVSVGDRQYDISDIKEAGSSEIKGEFGTLTIKADGSYTYKANPNVQGNAQDSFVLTITDADGDSRDVKLDVTVTPAATIAHVSVDEAGLTDGVEDEGSEVSGAIDVPGYTIVGVKQDGQYGTVSQDGEDNWHYTLTGAIDSGDAQGANTVIGADRVTLIVKDGHGNIFEVDVPVDIIDDVPSLDLNHASAVQDANGDHFQASFDFDFGADTKHGDQSASVSVTVDGETVKDGVTVNPDGTVIYEQSNEAVHTEFGTQGQAHDVTVTVTDADGDTTSQSVHLETVGVQVGNEHSNVVTGGRGSDIIIGDQGQTEGVQQPVTYNISLVLDISSSMEQPLGNGQSRMEASVEALKNLVDSIAEQAGKDGVTVNLQLVGFHSGSYENSWFSVTSENAAELKAYVDELASHIHDDKTNPAGDAYRTNYEAGLQNVYKWFAEHASNPAEGQVINKVYLVSDGVPNMFTGAFVHADTSSSGTFSSTYTDALGNTYTVPIDYITGETVTHADGQTLIDAQGNYYGYDQAGQWSVQGQVVHAGLSSSQWPKLPDYNGPKDPFDKDAFNAAKNSYEAEHGNGSFPYADTIAYYNAYAQAYILAHTQSYDKLLELIPGLEVNSAGFAGDGLNPDILDHFDNTQSSDILHDADDLHAALDPGQMIPPVFAGQDSLYGGAGNDVIFGDHVSFITDDSTLDGMDALRAAVQAHAAANGFAIGGGDAGIHQYILDHPEVVGSLDDPSSAADQNDLIVGGAGDDVLAGQGGDDVLLGDGENGQAQGGSSDALNALLGQHAHGSNLAAGVHDLIEHGSPQEIRDFVDGIEGSGVENAQDGNDYLFGGSGDDLLFGQGGDDKLFGGDGSDALFGGTGDDYLDGGNDAAADHLYGGSGNDLIVYHPNDVIDGGSGMDVLLVGNNEDMDRLFQGGSLDGNVSNVEMIVSGDINNLTNLDALKDIGITVNENSIDFGDGWQSTGSAHDGFNAWTNGAVTVQVGADVQVSAQDSLQQQAEVAAQKICADNG